MSNLNKEYLDNQRKQRKSFKEYRNRMIKMGIGVVAAFASFTLLPELLAPVYTFLAGHIGEYLAGSLVFWAEIITLIGGGLGAIYNGVKAVSAKNVVDKSQDEEEVFVKNLIDEHEKLNEKVESLTEQIEKVNDYKKSETKTDEYRKVDAYTDTQEKVKVKK